MAIDNYFTVMGEMNRCTEGRGKKAEKPSLSMNDYKKNHAYERLP